MKTNMVEGAHYCPVCGKHIFNSSDSYEDCPVCDWTDNRYQEQYPDEGGCENLFSLNKAKRRYEQYGTVLPYDLWEDWAKTDEKWASKLKNTDMAPDKYTGFLRR